MESHSATELEKLHMQLKTLQEVEVESRHRGDLVTSLQEELELVRQELEKNKEVIFIFFLKRNILFYLFLFIEHIYLSIYLDIK